MGSIVKDDILEKRIRRIGLKKCSDAMKMKPMVLRAKIENLISWHIGEKEKIEKYLDDTENLVMK
jgi:hypothetical protein